MQEWVYGSATTLYVARTLGPYTVPCTVLLQMTFLPFTLVFAACCYLLLCSPVSSAAANTTNCTVSSSGLDGPECLAGTSPCQTLEYVLSNARSCAVVNVLASQNLSSPVVVASPRDLSIIGDITSVYSIHIWCTNSSGLSFVSPQNILLENLNFVGCAARWNYTNIGGYPFIEFAGVYFYRGFDVQILGCSFSNGTGTGVILYDITGNNLLSGVNFLGNNLGSAMAENVVSGGLLIRRETSLNKDTIYCIKYCFFTENANNASLDSFRLGGGMTLYLAAPSSTTLVIICNSSFIQNIGGGVRINQVGGNSSLTINVTDSHFILNHAINEGGGIYLQQDKAFVCSCYLSLVRTHFISNHAKWGGGLAVFTATSNGSVDVEAYDSQWSRNSAKLGGSAVDFSVKNRRKGRPSNQTFFLLRGNFNICIFRDSNYRKNNSSVYNLVSVGAIHMKGSTAEFYNSTFRHTFGSALYLYGSSYAVFSGNTSFSFNTNAIQGGAIYIGKTSLIALKSGTTLQFHNNSAIMEGGAIYSEAVGSSDISDDACIFESLGSLLGKIKVNFSYNEANNEDGAIFVGSPKSCQRRHGDEKENLLFDGAIFTYYPNKPSQVVSYASNISFDSDPNMTDAKRLKVMLGESFSLKPRATDIFHNMAHVSGNLEFLSTHASYKLVGPNFIGLDNFTEQNSLYITGPEGRRDTNSMELHFIYSKPSSYHKGDVRIYIEIVDCRIGFAYNSTSQMCECKQEGSLLCSPLKRYACVQYGYWYGQQNQTDGKPLECPWINCKYNYEGCPGKICPDHPGFCQLDEEDDLCWEGRSGLLCSSCRQNHSFTFGAISCMPTDTCPPKITTLIILGVIVYWIFFVCFVLLVLSTDLSIGSGFMYGIIYFFSVQNLFTESTVTDYFLMVLIDTCTALTQISPRAFGDINACFIPSWNLNLHHKLFHFVSPAFVIVVIGIIILASRYCRCPRSISLAENSPIHAICMLILFSYTSMVYTIFYILKPIKIKGEMRVFVDPHLRYFHEEHLPYAIVALLCEFLLVLPICFLLLFAPCLSRRVNLVKLRLKPILDEFQACYRPRYRWFAGFYFLARQLVFLAYILPVDQGNSALLHCTNVLILIVHCTCQPYRQKWLNLLDNILLVDILLLSFFHLELAPNFMHQIVPYILILPPAFYLILVVLLIIVKRVLHCLQSTRFFKFISQCREHKTTELPSTVRKVSRTSVGVDEDDLEAKMYEGSGFFRDSGEREPLLCENDSKQTSYSSEGNKRRAFTTTVLKVDDTNPPKKNSTN